VGYCSHAAESEPREITVSAQLKPTSNTADADFCSVVASILSSDQCELPVLPEASAQLLRMTSDVDCDVTDVIKVIRGDQSLTSHLLRIANSVRYNMGVTVTSIQQAVARLGLLTIRQIVVLISCQCRIFDVPGFEADVRCSFQRSLAAAALAQEIARVRRLNVEEAFLCGLLHDVGRPVLLQALMDRRRNAGLVFSDDELRNAAETHRIEFASRLITCWELPSRLSQIIRHQSVPLEAESLTDNAAILNLSIDLAEMLLSSDAELKAEQLVHPMIGVLNLYPEQLGTVLRKRDEILEWVRSTV
jgi:HD-like signal output (HDOD) protein